jgi:hypothetical protein
MKTRKGKHLSSTALASLVLLLATSGLVASAAAMQVQEKKVQVAEGQSIVFDFIEPHQFLSQGEG